ncbi:MAG: diaminobutyrate--2-oxoglutarate transaminase [Pseudomonadales bacterium]|jgi:diaminobutyrate-2-oxoglutarate transaminase|uniref:diaminobutyrate--2-oxoglutarate transaminase n=1 Tax=unclassified Ketobacter TaxID=2639109 RepID=UPI000C373026|nr:MULTISPECIES: diaminobutyrate--2-oxoglutarate transaminase [unclassified Ketobacter]MAQ25847.1 diaminobutyrate--2-oxoglutarate transaminase [Pseudomonadales bacterium]MEC8810932.1 diaminobutyrate--2-oxoglutarate transaminase [Pseudomonadota bacterium]TNC89041.1 MAG: diaminobutyrate--2-oxoglutarate transaminase [Alcanivorax sp.]HAG94550.1 diaminobutyrate--2-oxoglutarate transaminase [Gammaproteobacteria bacterium]MBI28050.1 diaminobutyrate--2-oxoglutarate transaminase [Pseudomonadales bacter|tara:strand:- start:13560 stop:14816 length:1257 start_codon:yes stop_codon:yes gene_type:complete
MRVDVFQQYESEVRSYCRSFPTVFTKAKGSYIEAQDGQRYLDFFAGAGALNFGHNPDLVKQRLIEYLQEDGILHGLDMYTDAKGQFLQALQEQILQPKSLDYRVQFCGPTGTNAVEAALKIARKVKGRRNIFAFQGGYHGMTLGALACTGNSYNRKGAGTALPDVTFMPFPFGPMKEIDTIAYLDAVLSDSSSGIEKPAAVLLETVQAEGGVVVAPTPWLKQLRSLCDKHDILMIVDDIQVGCGRSGNFFSFERAGIVPDIVTLSKSISGCGLPLAVVLLKPELDVWQPGEHNGTFRGNQLAFVSGTVGIELFQSLNLPAQVAEKSQLLQQELSGIIDRLDARMELRGLGMIWGVDLAPLGNERLIDQITSLCFQDGLIIENAGRKGQVLKLLPPLTASSDELHIGLEIIERAMKKAL